MFSWKVCIFLKVLFEPRDWISCTLYAWCHFFHKNTHSHVKQKLFDLELTSRFSQNPWNHVCCGTVFSGYFSITVQAAELNVMSTCLHLWWNAPFFDKALAPWLSSHTSTVFPQCLSISLFCLTCWWGYSEIIEPFLCSLLCFISHFDLLLQVFLYFSCAHNSYSSPAVSKQPQLILLSPHLTVWLIFICWYALALLTLFIPILHWVGLYL